MSHKILVTPRSFGRSNPKPLEMLRERGYELILNPFGRILTEAEMCEAIADADAVIIGVDPLNEQVLRHASRLRAISKYGVGTDNIDLAWAEQAGIPVALDYFGDVSPEAMELSDLAFANNTIILDYPDFGIEFLKFDPYKWDFTAQMTHGLWRSLVRRHCGPGRSSAACVVL